MKTMPLMLIALSLMVVSAIRADEPAPKAPPNKPETTADEVTRLRDELAKAQAQIKKQQVQIESLQASESAYKTAHDVLFKEKTKLTEALRKRGINESDPIGYVIDTVLAQNLTAAEWDALKKRLDKADRSLLEREVELVRAKEMLEHNESDRRDDQRKLEDRR
jgi:hypothetical protein